MIGLEVVLEGLRQNPTKTVTIGDLLDVAKGDDPLLALGQLAMAHGEPLAFVVMPARTLVDSTVCVVRDAWPRGAREAMRGDER